MPQEILAIIVNNQMIL